MIDVEKLEKILKDIRTEVLFFFCTLCKKKESDFYNELSQTKTNDRTPYGNGTPSEALATAVKTLDEMEYVGNSKLGPIYLKLISFEEIREIRSKNSTSISSSSPFFSKNNNSLVSELKNVVRLLVFLHNIAYAFEIKNYNNRSAVDIIEATPISKIEPTVQNPTEQKDSSFNVPGAGDAVCLGCGSVCTIV